MSDERLPSGRATGIALLIASVLTVALMATHPTVHAHEPAEFIGAVARQATTNAVVHGSLIVLMGILVYCYSCLASRLGLDSACVRAGLVAYVMGIVAVMPAALTGGFLIPEFVERFRDRPAQDLLVMKHILTLCSLAMQLGTRVWVVATSAAVILWSVALTGRGARTVGVLGVVAGVAPLVALAAGRLPTNVHGVGAFVLVQAVWGVAVGVLMIRGRI